MKSPFLRLALILSLLATPAFAQTAAGGSDDKSVVGEKYWVEFTATFWQPGLSGNVQSDRLGLIGSTVDFAQDLGFGTSTTSDIRFVVRPAKKHKFRFQYTPVEFAADSVLTRDISFAGQTYPVSLPIQSTLKWTVIRAAYEWDFLYKSRGFVGVIVEVRSTQLSAGVDSAIGGAAVTAEAPFPGIGFVGRFYPIRRVAIHIEGTGIRLSDSADHAFQGLDFDATATYNVFRTLGVSGGWRRMNANLRFDDDRGTLNFTGLWFGGVFRY